MNSCVRLSKKIDTLETANAGVEDEAAQNQTMVEKKLWRKMMLLDHNRPELLPGIFQELHGKLANLDAYS